MNNRNPQLTVPITPRTRATVSSGRCRLKRATATVHAASMSTHSNMDPSCEPQVAAKR